MDRPLLFAPLLKTRVWGGDTLLARSAGGGAEGPIGESWEVADHGEDTTLVREGPDAGRSLHEIFTAEKDALCGQAVDAASPEVFPLLLKLIDARKDLSVQVHPDDAYAGKRKAGELGKTEAWYVLDTAPEGRIYRGLREGVTKESFAAAIENGTVADCLVSFTPRPGDVVYIPAGTIHALGAGVRIAEIQQNSDTTYRVFDWNRVGLDGKPRELHVDDALAVSRFETDAAPTGAPETIPHAGCRRERFVACEKFHLERLDMFRGRPVRLDTGGATFHILTVVNGEAAVRCAGGKATLPAWDTCLVPAAAGEYFLHPSIDATLLLFHRPA